MLLETPRACFGSATQWRRRMWGQADSVFHTFLHRVKADLDCCRQENRAVSVTTGAQCMREGTSEQWGQLDWPCPTPTTLPRSTSTAHELACHISKACFNLMCRYESYQPESPQESNVTVFPPLSILKTLWNGSSVHPWFKFTTSLRRFLFVRS